MQGHYHILRSQKEHAEFLAQAITDKKIDKIQLASFGLWAGINNDGSTSQFSTDNPIANLLTLAESSNIRTEIVIGIPPFHSRAGFKLPPCIYCADSHRRMLQRTFQCRKQWPNTLWFYHPSSHTKLAIGWKDNQPLWAVTGGHNLADSNLTDFSIVMENAGTTFAPIFEELKTQSDPDISEIRLGFEEKVIDAALPPNPKNTKTSDGKAASCGIFQKDSTPNAVPQRQIPPVEDVILLLNALAHKAYLDKDEFTRVAKSSAWIIDQNNHVLRPAAQPLENNPKLQEALLEYQNFKKG